MQIISWNHKVSGYIQVWHLCSSVIAFSEFLLGKFSIVFMKSNDALFNITHWGQSIHHTLPLFSCSEYTFLTLRITREEKNKKKGILSYFSSIQQMFICPVVSWTLPLTSEAPRWRHCSHGKEVGLFFPNLAVPEFLAYLLGLCRIFPLFQKCYRRLHVFPR